MIASGGPVPEAQNRLAEAKALRHNGRNGPESQAVPGPTPL
jgi:hypothetical protein